MSGEVAFRWQGKDLSVTVLFSAAGVATGVLVEAGGGRLLFDAGDGTLRDLLSLGVPPESLCGLFFTHGHFDHMGGLYALLGYLRSVEHRGPLYIGYPGGCCETEAVLEAFLKCHRETTSFLLDVHALQDGDRVLVCGVEVLAREVVHWHSVRSQLLGPAPALGYRLTFRGQSVALSGDSGDCPALWDLVEGADLALIEATLEQEDPQLLARLHLCPARAEAIGRLAKKFFLIHRPFRRSS